MQMYQCPTCGNRSVAWDARSGVFVCYMTDCLSWFFPPSAEEACGLTDVPTAISSGQLTITQEWLDKQRSAKSPAEVHPRRSVAG